MLNLPYTGFEFVASVIMFFVLNKVSIGKVSICLECFVFAVTVIMLLGQRIR
jgi:hypothetical protein